MNNEDTRSQQTGSHGGPSDRSGLLARVRNRTENEQDASSATDLTLSTAGLGQAPYVAVGSGIVIVQRNCHHGWNC